MLNETILNDKIERARADIDRPNSVNSFAGTWAISDHKAIPEPVRMFLMLSFGTGRLERVELDKINELLNEVWQGPGSLEIIYKMEYELNKSVNMSTTDMPKLKATKVEVDDRPLADATASASDFNFEATLD